MAEFVEVMQKKEEMCKYYGTCMCCQLSHDNNRYEITCSAFIHQHPQEAEKIIIEWQKPVDWSKVKVDTPILVRDNEDKDWLKRHFAKYEDGKVFAWMNGATSWSTSETSTRWNYAKLVEKNETDQITETPEVTKSCVRCKHKMNLIHDVSSPCYTCYRNPDPYRLPDKFVEDDE